VTPQRPAQDSLALGSGPEFDRIRKIIQELGARGSGLGDDCGLIQTSEGVLALSTDVSVEGVHFRLDWIGFADVGWRATAAALSDLAAEGADALGVLCAVTMPAHAPELQLIEVMSGAGAAAASVGAPVLGGDLSSGPGWSVAVTVIGRAPRPVTRGGSQPGDRLWVTGTLGGSRAALEAWRRGETPQPESRKRFARPEPRIAAGRWLAEHGARAMIDLSDGLAGDADHLAAASGVGIDVELDALPVDEEVKAEARRHGVSPGQFAAEGGEDFELLAALPPTFDGSADFGRECGIALTRIGTVRAGSGVRFLHEGAALKLQGFTHFG
jgi:thiamine-monophosphate kinase